MSDIIQTGDKVLKEKAKDISKDKIKSKEIKDLIALMFKVLASTKDGVALAAPQIGKSLRIFIVSSKFLSANKEDVKQNLVFVNPKIIKTSSKKNLLPEGCLSVEGKQGEVKRFDKITVEAFDENGDKFTRGMSGVFAQIIQHEVDHLDGTLFIDKAINVREIEWK